MLQINHYTKQYSANGPKAVDDLSLHIKPGEITIAGGAVKSPTWRQIVADVMNKRVKVLKQADASIIGVAIIAAKAAGFIKDFQEGVDKMVEIDCTVDPIPENAALYEKLFDIYKDLYKMFKEYNISGRLAEAVKK